MYGNLTITALTSLNKLYAYNVGATAFDFSGNSSITWADVYNNSGVTSLDFSNNPLINVCRFQNNSLTVSEVNNVLLDLDSFGTSGGNLNFSGNANPTATENTVKRFIRCIQRFRYS